MRKLTIAALVAAQLLTAQPALAAELAGSRSQELGAFAGVRLRVPLDDHGRERQVRASLALAPALHTRTSDGETRLRIGEGLELGVVGREPAQLSIGGTPVSRLAEGPTGPDGRRLGVSTLGWIAIGAGVAVLAVGGFYVWLLEETECGPREC